MQTTRTMGMSVLGLGCALALIIPTVGAAASGTLGAHTVAAKYGANVRKASKTGARTSRYIGHLKKGDSFTTTKKTKTYCFGHAGGHVDRDGWVLCASLSK